jgi:hypothetical protein
MVSLDLFRKASWPLDYGFTDKKRLFRQMKTTLLLAFDARDRPIGDFWVGPPLIARRGQKKPPGTVTSNNLDASHRFAAGPLANGFEALFGSGP